MIAIETKVKTMLM